MTQEKRFGNKFAGDLGQLKRGDDKSNGSHGGAPEEKADDPANCEIPCSPDEIDIHAILETVRK